MWLSHNILWSQQVLVPLSPGKMPTSCFMHGWILASIQHHKLKRPILQFLQVHPGTRGDLGDLVIQTISADERFPAPTLDQMNWHILRP